MELIEHLIEIRNHSIILLFSIIIWGLWWRMQIQ